MKPRLIVLIFMVLVSAGAIILILNDRWSTVDGGLDGMLLKSPEKIDRIELIGSSDSLVMYKSGMQWQLGNAEVLNNSSIESLLYTASNFRLRSIISSVEILDLQDYIKLNFYRGKKSAASFNFFIKSGRPIIYMEGSENAYMVELPGYSDLLVGKAFSLNPNHYREHLLISLLPMEISSLKIIPLKGRGFSLTQDTAAYLQIRNIEGDSVQVEERKIRMLLSYFAAVRYEDRLAQEMIPVDFNPLNPSAEIRITDMQGNTNVLLIFQWIKAGEESPDLFEALVLYNSEPQLLIVNYTHLDILIRSLENYLPTK